MGTWSAGVAAQLITAHGIAHAATRAGVAPDDLAAHLYAQWYAAPSRPTGTPDPWAPPLPTLLRAAHGASRRWEDDERTVLATGAAGVVVVAAATGPRSVCRGDYVTVTGPAGLVPAVGDRVRIVAREGGVVSEGWWRTWGSGWRPRQVPAGLTRIYLRPREAALAPLVHDLTATLDRIGRPWCLKCVADPAALGRPDAVVVYVERSGAEVVLDGVLPALDGRVRGEPPPLTCRLADGLAWAEDPGSGESFGEVRCAAVAAAYGRLKGDHTRWLDVVEEDFRARGLDPEQPWLASSEGGGRDVRAG